MAKSKGRKKKEVRDLMNELWIFEEEACLIKDGDWVKINVEKILKRPDRNKLDPDYIKYVREHKNNVYVANSLESNPFIFELDKCKYTFHFSDLTKYVFNSKK